MRFETFAQACKWLIATGYEFKPLFYAAPEGRQNHTAGFWVHDTNRAPLMLASCGDGSDQWLVWS